MGVAGSLALWEDSQMTTFTFADLFAGIGGFHHALSSIGGRCVYAVEKDKAAAMVYEANWGMDPLGDVTTDGWLDKVTEKVDVLVAGFPCQPFSKGGKQLGMSEARGTLFYSICEALDAWKPRVVLLENVRNLAGPRHMHEWDVIIAALRELGYRVCDKPLIVSPHWLTSFEGGAPQSRERVFIMATLVAAGEDLEGDLTFKLGAKSSRPEWELVTDLPMQQETELDPGELLELTSGPLETAWISAWGDLVAEIRGTGELLPSFPIWYKSWYAGAGKESRALGDAAWKTKFVDLNEAWYLDHAELLDAWVSRWNVYDFPESRQKMEWQAQDATSIDDCLVQMRPSGLRVKKATHTGALVAIDQRPLVWSRGRRLSVRECARLQGLPEWFSFDAVPRRAAFKQLGNGVNAGVARAVFLSHVTHPDTVSALGLDDPIVLAAMEHTAP